MTRRVLQIGLPLIILGVGLFGGYWLITHRNQVAPAPIAPLKPRVEYIVAQMRDYTPVIRSQGIARPRGQTLLSPELSGRLTHVSGSLVNGALLDSGTVLARIDDADFKLALRTADADLETYQLAETRIQQDREQLGAVNVDEEVTDLMRYQRAFQGTSKVIGVLDQLLETVVTSLVR